METTQSPPTPAGAAETGPATGPATGRKATVARYAFVFGFPFVLVMMLVGIYVGSMHAPAPHDMPVAVVGSGAEAERAVATLNATDGSPADARLVATPQEAEELLHDRDIAGALALPGAGGADDGQAVLYTAQAAGASQTMTATQLLTPVAAGMDLTVVPHEVAPLPEGDMSGVAVMFMGVGMMLSGYMAVTVLSNGAPELMTLRRLVPLLIGWGALMSLVIWTLAGPVVGAVSGHTAEILGIGWLAVVAVGLTQALLSRLAGPLAVIPGIALFMFLGVPASNLALSVHTMPGFFSFLHDVLPLPAAGESLRAVLYFGGDGAGGHLLTLAAWAAAALLLTAVIDTLRGRKGERADAPALAAAS
ncbi:ABC transporter permease [Streptomyces avicenniae]|uniref:ABC transporter permease n=1 Tax=Streptomyces avicenniae TaxID=500153 RepID=UPI00069BEA25|nr:ABC transporter permease [Streptomyces avicenniae]